MTNNIIPFTYNQKQVRIVTGPDGEPWWVASDVCGVLDINNPREALRKLDDDEKNTVTFSDGIPGNPNMNVVNEPGLYTLIIRSNKPEAKKFKRWITHEVLPSIRKSGTYSAPSDDVECISRHQLAEVAFRVKQVMTMVKAYGFRQAEARMIANDVVRDATGVDTLDLLGVKDDVAAEYAGGKHADADSRLPTLSKVHAGWISKKMIADFLEACCTIQEGLVTNSTRLYEAFAAWYVSQYNSKTIPSRRMFGRLFGEHFQKFKSGFYYYQGLGLKDPAPEQEVSAM